MEYKEFYEALLANHLITPIWREVLELVEKELDDNEHKQNFLILFTIMFSLLDDGNVCMSLNKDHLSKRWFEKLEGKRILLEGEETLDKESYEKAFKTSKEVIEKSLKDMTPTNLSKVTSQNKFFVIEDEWIYIRKDYVARKSLLKSIERLFDRSKETTRTGSFDYKQVMKEVDKKGRKKYLRKAQEEVVKLGLSRNLLITGGPGTGKTTSIFYLLVGLLLNNPNYSHIYLMAPSGKAARQMKDSISGEQESVREDFLEKHGEDTIKRIVELKRSTIHKALEIDGNTGAFRHNENYKFDENSIFVIDEASMIDICLFASLLKAIPDDARVFIMGDKDQLPSVESGSVFADLLENRLLKDHNVVRLTETIRFEENSPVYNLAQEVNSDNNKDITTLTEESWMAEEFKLQEHGSEIKNPVYAFKMPEDNKDQKKMVKAAIEAFGKKYYANLQKKCIDLTEQTDFKQLYADTVETASILTAENHTIRGVIAINAFIKDKFIDKKVKTPIQGFYPGELMMINKNNNLLDLANGDSGVLVTFKDDNTLYFMTQKDSELIEIPGKRDGKIFKLGGCMFYPFSMITRSEIDNSYAITIHKSQGSGYQNILIILPTKEGHPLLNRQILYTAITRTKGDTYILSNQKILNFAKKTVLTRDTNVK